MQLLTLPLPPANPPTPPRQDAIVQAVKHQNQIFNRLRWGEGPARVVLEMAHPEHTEIELETAPFALMPHAIHYFLTLIETG